MLGVAVGQIGLGVEEFYDLTFDEFSAITESYYQKQEMEFKMGWEQARFAAYYAVVPHSKKKLKLTDIVRFDWEKKKVKLPAREVLDKLFPKTIK